MLELSSLHLSTYGVSSAASSIPSSIAHWHSHLCHVSVSRVQVLAFKVLLGSMSTSSFDCISYQIGKQSPLLFNNIESIAFVSFDLILSYVWGPSLIPSISVSRYFVIFVDDYSCYSWMFLMKSHSQLLDIYQNFA